MVSIHAPVKGATGEDVARTYATKVSIHAPVKGATGRAVGEGVVEVVSIHAPVKGATSRSTIMPQSWVFQSTRP